MKKLINKIVRLGVGSGWVGKKCTRPEPALGSGSGRVGFVHGPTLPTTRAGTRTRVGLAIMGKVRARAQKCGSLLIY